MAEELNIDFKLFADNLQIKEPMIMTDQLVARRFVIPEYNSPVVLTPKDPRDALIAKVAQVAPEAAQWLRENREIMCGTTDALNCSFPWVETPQGHRYWENIHVKISHRNNLLYPDLEDSTVFFGVDLAQESDADRACRLEHERIKEKFYPAPRKIRKDYPDLRPWPAAWHEREER